MTLFPDGGKRIYVHRKDQFPSVPHWAILYFGSVHVPAQGVWAPGHGYPEHDEPTIEYVAFLEEAEWVAEIKKLESEHYRRSYIAIPVGKPATTSIEVHVKT